MRNKKILISGAGVAGLALAYWLRHYGFSPTVLERAPVLRTGGYKVDIRGAALEVVKRMDLYAAISEARTDIQGATIVDRFGNSVAEMSGDTFGLRVSADLEIMRGDLCRLLKAQAGEIEYVFGNSIKAMAQESEGVLVQFEQGIGRFEKGPDRIFDLVIGADGLHSSVRKLTFGADPHFMQELGLYISIFTVPNFLNLDRWEIEYADNHKLVNLYSARGESDAKAAFLFVSKHLHFNPRDIKQQQRLLADAYAGLDWEVPRLLEAMAHAPDFYFDSVTQIKMDKWSKGRVALVGDAGYCASPASGQGTSLALVGAFVLAGELAAASGNYETAFSQYEKRMRRFVEENQRLGQVFAKNMTGENKNKWVVWLHDQFMRILPGKWMNFMTNRSVNRVKRAANAITLADYFAV